MTSLRVFSITECSISLLQSNLKQFVICVCRLMDGGSNKCPSRLSYVGINLSKRCMMGGVVCVYLYV